MSFFDFELPKKDLDQLEERLRVALRELSDEQRKIYYSFVTSRLRDPDTYVVLCWSLGLGLHHLYLGRWRAFLFDLLAGLCLYGTVIFLVFHGYGVLPVLLLLGAFLYASVDTLYSLVLSQRIVQKHNIHLGLAWLQQRGNLPGHGEQLDRAMAAEEISIARHDRQLFAFIAVGILGLGLAVWLFYAAGLPMIAKYVAFSLPDSIFLLPDEEEAAKEIDQLDAFSSSHLPPSSQERLQELFASLNPEKKGGEGYFLFLRNGGKLGANAFAFPRGQVVVTDALVALAENDQELLAVMAHELGHLQHRHGIQTFLQNSTLLVIVAAVTGDLASVAGAVGIMMNAVLNAGYSRQFELEADQYALQYFRQKHLPIQHFVNLLGRLGQGKKAEGSEHGFLSSHPPTEERILRLTSGQ